MVVQDLTLGEAPVSRTVPVSVAIRSQFFLLTCLGLVFVNALTFAYNLTASTLFNALGNAVSLLLIAYAIYVAAAAKAGTAFYRTIAVLACVFVVASFLVNHGSFEKVDALKYLAVYIFFLAGRCVPGRPHPLERWLIFVLIALPLVFLMVGQSRVYFGAKYPDVFAYFPNTNTTALYFCALFFTLSPWLGNKVLLLQLIAAALMNRVGPAFATIVAIGTWSIFPLRKQVFAAFFVLGVGGIVAYAVGALDRLLNGLESMALIWSLSPSTVSRMTYKQLVDLTGTTDLSAFFRVIHWTNIWDYYSTQGFVGVLFGYGAGQTALLTYLSMPPHNDYLRVLAEYGLFSFLVFAAFVISIMFSIKMQAARILFTVLLIYFMSENLLDNFTSMALFFAYAGRFTSASSSSDHAQHAFPSGR